MTHHFDASPSTCTTSTSPRSNRTQTITPLHAHQPEHPPRHNNIAVRVNPAHIQITSTREYQTGEMGRGGEHGYGRYLGDECAYAVQYTLNIPDLYL